MNTLFRVIRLMTHLYLALLLGSIALLYLGQESWWLTRQISFGPRWIAGLPLIMLVPLLVRRQAVLCGELLCCAVLVFGPLMGYTFQFNKPSVHGEILRIMSCSVGDNLSVGEELSGLVLEQGMDVLMLQNCPPGIRLNLPSGWKSVQHGRLAVFSRYDLITPSPNSTTSESKSYISCTVKSPSGDVTLTNAAFNDVRQWTSLPTEKNTTRALLAGSFPLTCENKVFRQRWSDMTNAFSAAGKGYGWTESKTTRGIPWGIRADQMLVSGALHPVFCEVGPDIGASHRPLIAELVVSEP